MKTHLVYIFLLITIMFIVIFCLKEDRQFQHIGYVHTLIEKDRIYVVITDTFEIINTPCLRDGDTLKGYYDNGTVTCIVDNDNKTYYINKQWKKNSIKK